LNEQLSRVFGSALIWKGIQLVGVKVIFLFRTLVLARLLVPEDFGLLAISMIAVDFLLSITDFGMVPALIQRSDVQDEHYDAAWTLGILRAFGVAVLVLIAASLIADIFSEPRATNLIRVLALRPVIEASMSIRVSDLFKDLRFRPLALIYIAEAVANTFVSVILAEHLGVWAMVAGSLAGPAALVVASYIQAPYRPKIFFDISIARPLVNFGKWIFLTGLVSVVGSSVVQMVISRRLGASELGLYFLAAKIAFIPYEVSSQVVGSVSFPLYAQLQSDGHQVSRAFRSIIVGVSALLLPMCFLMIALAPALVDNVLGPRWEGTAPLIRILTLVSIIDLLGVTVFPVLKGVGKPSRLVAIEGSQTLLLLVLVWGMTGYFGVIGAALAWLPAILVSQTIAVYFMKRILPKPFAGLGLPMSMISVACILGAITALIVYGSINELVGFISSAFVAGVVIACFLWISDRRFSLGLGSDLSRAFPQVSAIFNVVLMSDKA
jgi:O-antigen/teichoic acid export membrane protein